MSTIFRYEFDAALPFEEIEASLVLAIFAAESLHGQAEVRLEAAHALDPEARTCVIDASSCVGHDISRLFTGFLIREFSEDAFSVERVEPAVIQPAA